ncbi:hypothetical protein V8B97DRAFT_221826 [Scleroderma yunnanense]
MSDFVPIQLKGEIMDLDFTIDTDHRKRRRNRTTQSCLNCHTSKRKCDRKRPCQRCIQLGLTGLCVYEIDDPALRDDPTIDEATRLRNRIAELESLVRELRGKPHPRWADSTGDPSDRWHSRAAKNGLHLRRRTTAAGGSLGENGSNGQPVKPEPLTADISQPHLYRFTPSPPAQTQPQQSTGYPSMGYTTTSSPSDSSHTQHHTQQQQHHQSHSQLHHHQSFGCSCRTNPALVSLGHQLQNTLAALGHHHPHSSSHQRHPNQHVDQDATACSLYKRISELSGVMQSTIGMPLSLTDPSSGMLHTSGAGSGSGSGIPSNSLGTSSSHSIAGGSGPASGARSPYSSPPYGTLPTPTDSETHSPPCGTPFHVSGSTSSSSPSSPSSSSIGTGAGTGAGANVDWTYNPYFPMQVSGGMSGVGMGGMSNVGMVGVGVGENGGMYGSIIAA